MFVQASQSASCSSGGKGNSGSAEGETELIPSRHVCETLRLLAGSPLGTESVAEPRWHMSEKSSG